MADLRLSSMRIRRELCSLCTLSAQLFAAVWQSGADQKAVLQRLVQVVAAAFALPLALLVD